MALDEGSSLHEASIGPVRDAFDAHGLLFNAWVIPWGIVVVVLAMAYARFFRALPQRIRAMFSLAAIAFIAAAIGLEMVEGFLFDSAHATGWPFAIAVLSGELIEMSALAVFVYVLLIDLAASAGTLHLGAEAGGGRSRERDVGNRQQPGIITSATFPATRRNTRPGAEQQTDGPA